MQKEGRGERELRPKRTFGRGCEMKESRGGVGVSRRKRSRRKSRVWSGGGRAVEKSGGKRESRKLK